MSEGSAPRARVGVRELRQNLSVYLDRVKAGERLGVTEHGQLVAELGPPPSQPMTRLDQLIAEGKATRGKGNLVDLGPPIELPPGSPSLAQILAEMREEEEY
jgi:antitoxin (DNA-binding transcriptional repressor) of toxin-antitoxin stability system